MATDNSKLNVVAVGASAGGVEALKNLVSGLPTDLPSAISVALHVPAAAPRVSDRILVEKLKLSRRLAGHVTPGLLGKRYEAIADEAEHATAVLSEPLAAVYRGERAADE